MREIDVYDAVGETLDRLGSGGLLLVTGEEANPMTIGWGTIGRIWGLPVFTVLVRPSRYSFGLIEELDEFTVSVPAAEQKKALGICGSKSGRDTDKKELCGFTARASEHVRVPFLAECPIHYECRVVHRTNVNNPDLDPTIVAKSYGSGDFHRIYHGEILGVYRAD